MQTIKRHTVFPTNGTTLIKTADSITVLSASLGGDKLMGVCVKSESGAPVTHQFTIHMFGNGENFNDMGKYYVGSNTDSNGSMWHFYVGKSEPIPADEPEDGDCF